MSVSSVRQAQQIFKEPPAQRGHEQARTGAGRQRRSAWGIRSNVATGLCELESRARGGARGESSRCTWMPKRAAATLGDRATWRSEITLNSEIRVLGEHTTHAELRRNAPPHRLVRVAGTRPSPRRRAPWSGYPKNKSSRHPLRASARDPVLARAALTPRERAA